MKSFEPPGASAWLTPRRVVLAATFGLALALGLASSRLAAPLRSTWRDALRPALEIVDTTLAWVEDCRNRFRVGDDANLVQAQRQIAELNDCLRRAELQLQLAQGNRAADLPDGQKPLLMAQTISARVLGKQAQSFLDAQQMLDVGRSRGATARSLV